MPCQGHVESMTYFLPFYLLDGTNHTKMALSALRKNWDLLRSSVPKSTHRALPAEATPPPASETAPHEAVALDCEMVGIGHEGREDALARASVVDSNGKVLIDIIVRPDQRITDFRQHITGLSWSMIKNGVPHAEACERVQHVLRDRIVVGHGLQNDFAVLGAHPPEALIRDTARYKPFRAAGCEKKVPKLKELAGRLLNMWIHDRAHDSVEDAQVAMRLYRSAREEWEKRFEGLMAKDAPTGVAPPRAGKRRRAEDLLSSPQPKKPRKKSQ
eukprot:Polyplicarium_translucidae@DN3256_c0_g1_i3.p2